MYTTADHPRGDLQEGIHQPHGVNLSTMDFGNGQNEGHCLLHVLWTYLVPQEQEALLFQRLAHRSNAVAEDVRKRELWKAFLSPP